MALIKYHNWAESTAFTRRRREVALGLKPLASLGGNVNSHSTALPWEKKRIEKKMKTESKKKRIISKASDSNNLDSWLKEVDALEGSLEKLKAVKNKAKIITSKPPEKEDKKPEPVKDKDKPQEKEKEKESGEKEEKSTVDNEPSKNIWKSKPLKKSLKK